MDPNASDAQRDAAGVVFQAFHQSAGAAVGEHLGYMFTAVWTLLVVVAMMGSVLYPTWFGRIGVLAVLGILVGLSEPPGFSGGRGQCHQLCNMVIVVNCGGCLAAFALTCRMHAKRRCSR